VSVLDYKVQVAEMLQLRASNEGLSILYASLEGSGRGCPLLRASNEHPFHRARSASKKGTWPLPLILLRPRVARAREHPSHATSLRFYHYIYVRRHTIRSLLVRHPQLEPIGPFF
jgi:hypothetical protein